MTQEIETLMKATAALKRKSDAADLKASIAKKAYEDARGQLLGLMNTEHLDSMRVGKASASISRVDVAEVEDWDEFYSWIAKKKAYDTLQRRAAVRALLDRRENQRDGKIPGVKFSKVRRLTFKVAK